MRLLVTGGSGFIGTNVVEEFLQRGDDVCSIDTVPPRVTAHRDVFKKVDILDDAGVKEVFADFRPTEVIHLAARTDMEQRKGLEHFAANIAGVANLTDAITLVGGVQRTIFASSRLVFDLGYTPRHETDYHASTLYGQSKIRGEELVRAVPDGLGAWTIVRPTGIWGPWFGEPYLSFFSMVKKGIYVHPGRNVIRKSYGYVGNLVYQMQRLLEVDESQIDKKTFFLADYQPVAVSDWANRIAENFGARPVKAAPISALRVAAVVGDGLSRFGRRFPMNSFRLNNMTNDMLYDISDTETVVGPLPFTLEAGTTKTIEWMVQHGH